MHVIVYHTPGLELVHFTSCQPHVMLLESLSSPARSESPADVTFLQAIAPKYSALAEKYALADCLAAVHIFVMNPEQRNR